MNKKIEDLKEISQKECNAVFCDVRIDLKHTTKEKILKMLQNQAEINAAIKKELDTQNSAIKILRENTVKPGNIQISKNEINDIHHYAALAFNSLNEVINDRVNGLDKQECVLSSILNASRIRDICSRITFNLDNGYTKDIG